jgi:hypothetical protein
MGRNARELPSEPTLQDLDCAFEVSGGLSEIRYGCCCIPRDRLNEIVEFLDKTCSAVIVTPSHEAVMPFSIPKVVSVEWLTDELESPP